MTLIEQLDVKVESVVTTFADSASEKGVQVSRIFAGDKIDGVVSPGIAVFLDTPDITTTERTADHATHGFPWELVLFVRPSASVDKHSSFIAALNLAEWAFTLMDLHHNEFRPAARPLEFIELNPDSTTLALFLEINWPLFL